MAFAKRVLGRGVLVSPKGMSDPFSGSTRRTAPDSTHWISPGPFSGQGPESWFEDRATGEDLANRACILSGPLLVCVRVSIMAAVIAMLLMLRHLSRRAGDDRDDAAMCHTRGCASMGTLLAESANLSRDPCTDFTAYVCSGRWQNGGDASVTALAVLQQAWARRMHEVLEAKRTSSRTIGKAARMYRSCLYRGKNGVSRSVQELRGFLRDRHVNWPDEPRLDVEPLDLLLEFAVKWELPLWLRVRLMRYSEKKRRKVSMEPVARPPPFLEFRDADLFSREWFHYLNILSPEPSNTTMPHKGNLRQRMEKTFQIQAKIVDMLFESRTAGSITSTDGISQIFTFGQIATKTAAFTVVRLEGILNKHFQMIYPLVETDLVLTSDVVYLDRSFDIFKSFKKKDLLDALGWWLVMSSAVNIADGRYLATFDGLECAVQVEDIYKLLLAAEWMKLFSRGMLKTVKQLVFRIATSTFEASQRAPATKLNRSVFMAKLHPNVLGKLAVKLSPAPRYTTEPQLEDLYWRFPGGGEGSYIHQWLNARRNASGLVIKNVYDELSRLPHFYYDRPVTYDRPHNAIVMPATAFMEPLFFADGTDAMRYGSLGSTLATKVLSVVACSRAKRDDGCGYPALFNLAATSRYDCDKDSASVATSELVALQVAYNGYVNASKESLDVRLKNLPDHSAVQVFFMVWCYTRCFDAGFRIEATFCDDVVADMPAFREVFGCESTWS